MNHQKVQGEIAVAAFCKEFICSFKDFDYILNSVSTNWANLMLSLSFESLAAFVAEALMSTWVEDGVLGICPADDAHFSSFTFFVDFKHFQYHVLFI